MALDQEKQLMETTLRHIAFGDGYDSSADMIRLAAKALGQISDIRMKRMMKQAEAKIARAMPHTPEPIPVPQTKPIARIEVARRAVNVQELVGDSLEIDVDGVG